MIPAHVHVQGPVPETADVVPAVHKFVVGLLVRLAPLDEPHAPFTAAADTVFLTFSLKRVVVVEPPTWPGGSEEPTIEIVLTPFCSCVVSTGSENDPLDGMTSALRAAPALE